MAENIDLTEFDKIITNDYAEIMTLYHLIKPMCIECENKGSILSSEDISDTLEFMISEFKFNSLLHTYNLLVENDKMKSLEEESNRHCECYRQTIRKYLPQGRMI